VHLLASRAPVNTARFSDPATTAPLSERASLIGKSLFSPSELAVQQTPKQEGSSTAVVVGSLLGCFLLLLLVCFIIFLVTRRSREDSSLSLEPETMEEGNEMGQTNSIVEFDEWSEAISQVNDADEAFTFSEPDEMALG
jgi:hypothetical protein